GAHDADVVPTPPDDNDARTVTTEYDAAGRLVRKIFGAVEITTLTGVETGQPVATSEMRETEEKNLYDAFGNLVESIDRNGNRSLAYFDKVGRAVAKVDPAGYLSESDFDDQGNVVEQRAYAQALSLDGLTAGKRPERPAGDVAQIDRIYDAANRLIEEVSPQVKVGEDKDGNNVFTRVHKVFTYDENGNQLTRTEAAGAPEAATEHYYYDKLNRRGAAGLAGRAPWNLRHGGGSDTNPHKAHNAAPPAR